MNLIAAIKCHPEYSARAGEIMDCIRAGWLTEQTIGNLPACGSKVAGFDVFRLTTYLSAAVLADEPPAVVTDQVEQPSGKKKKGESRKWRIKL
ncbi:MAG: hypothetical protein E6R03_03375 [Hyphomicrobiaceae bacterium]|nr:MAG: hypothetical protein E6R03_03375 [Hyphomicrobiaceae bacterium]